MESKLDITPFGVILTMKNHGIKFKKNTPFGVFHSYRTAMYLYQKK
jgi:hypothetical protein